VEPVLTAQEIQDQFGWLGDYEGPSTRFWCGCRFHDTQENRRYDVDCHGNVYLVTTWETQLLTEEQVQALRETRHLVLAD